MNRVVVWMMVLGCWLLPVSAQTLRKATAAEQRSMEEHINEAAAALKTIDCRFTQVKTLRVLNDQLTSEGRMLFNAGRQLRWEYEQPYRHTLIINGDKVYIVSAKERQTVDIGRSRLFQSITRAMMNSVTGKAMATGQDFDCTMFVGGIEWQAVLTPKDRRLKKLFKEIRLHYSRQRQMVTKVEMTEQNGDTTVITLKDVKTNGRIDDKMFED